MNEQAEQLVTDAGEKVLAWLEATEGFAIEHAPLLAQEIVTWGIWGNGIIGAGLFMISMFSGAFIVWTVANPRIRNWAMQEDGLPYLIHVFTISVGMCIPIPMGIGYFMDALKAALVPRLYILEQIGGLF